jgi:hypothetical protein
MDATLAVKVFSVTKAKEREALGSVITSWLQQHPEFEVVRTTVNQSSDSEYHCLTITIFYRQPQ